MEFLQRTLDDAIARLRQGGLVREHGFTLLFVAVVLPALRYLAADWSGADFHDRQIGVATLADVSVAARGAVFGQCVLLFLAGLALGAWLLPRVARGLGASAWRAIEGLSAASLVLIGLATWRVVVDTTLAIVAAGYVLVILTTLVDRWTRRCEVVERGTYVAWIGATAFAASTILWDFVPERLPDTKFLQPGLVLAGGLAIDLLRRLVTAAGDEAMRARRYDRCVHALAPFAALAAAPLVRNEGYFLANQWGLLAVRPEHVEVGFVVVLGLWAIWRASTGVPARRLGRDGRLDLDRTLGFLTFPWIVGGLVAAQRYLFLHEASPDFFEPGNAGLMIEQWFDLGRVPMLETFSAHGLADSFFGFVYAALTGFRDESWGMYDYGFGVLAALATFHVLRAWLGSAIAAAFVTLALPAVGLLFPAYCAPVAVGVFVVIWIHRRPSTWAWCVFTWWIAFVFLWRLDMGFANALAAAFALVGICWILPEHRPPFGAIVRGTLLGGGVLLAGYLGACAWRGIDPIGQLLDFRYVVGSNQAFAYEFVANRRTEIVMNHVFVVPILVVATAILLVVRARGRVDRDSPAFFAVFGTLFFVAYYLANYPRGLVRHSFLEGANVMIASFSALVVAGSCRWWLPHARRVTVFAVFCLLASAWGFNLDPERPEGREVLPRGPLAERSREFLDRMERVAWSPGRIDRSPIVPWFPARNTAESMPFLAAELGPDETFLDLSNAPMLYFHAKRPSPHWLNHVMIAVGERLQLSLIAGLAAYDVPFVTLSGVPGRDSPTSVPLNNGLDGVSFRVRQFRLHAWVHERYDPLTTVGRWQVWIRKDRLLRREPLHESARHVATIAATSRADASSVASDAPADTCTFVLGANTQVVPGRVVLSPEKAYVLRIPGRSDRGARLVLEIETRSAHGTEVLRRDLVVPAGDRVSWYRIPPRAGFRTLRRLSLQPGAGLELRDVDVDEHTSIDALESDRLAYGPVSDDLRALPRVWGRARAEDPPATAGRPLRDLLGPTASVSRSLAVDPVSEFPWANGVLTTRAAFLRHTDDLATPLAVGDELTFAASGTRRVVELKGRVVFVDGPLLDPLRDGAPARVRRGDPLVAPEGEAPGEFTGFRRFYFAPIGVANVPDATAESATGLRSRTELVARIRSLGQGGTQVLVDYGLGESSLGRFTLELAPDADAHDYVLRLGMQYNWTSRACDWVLFSTGNERVRLERLTLEEGD